MREWKWMGMAGMAALVMALAAPADAQQCPKGKLRIYTSWPMQGAMLNEGTGMKNGVDMAVAEVGGVVAGYCLEVVNLDDASPQTGKWDGAVEAENANKAVADPLAIVYIGTYNSGAAKVSIPINNRAHLAQITPANTYPGLTRKNGAAPGEPEIYRPMGFVNYFRVPPPDDVQGTVGAKWAKLLGAKKVYVINDQELYGKGIADVFEAAAKKIGLQVAANEGLDYKQPDQKPLLTKVRASGADMVYMAGVVDTGAPIILRQMKDLGLVAARGVRLLGPDGLYEEEVLKAGTCDAAIGTEMRITFASLPFEKMKGIGAIDLRELQEEVRQGAERVRALLDGVRAHCHRRHQARGRRHREGRQPDGEARGRPEGHRRAQELRRAERQVQLRRERRHHERDHVRVQGREERQGPWLHVPVRVHPRIGD